MSKHWRLSRRDGAPRARLRQANLNISGTELFIDLAVTVLESSAKRNSRANADRRDGTEMYLQRLN